MNIREAVKWNREELTDGIAWVVFYKNGRSWDSEAFWSDYGGYEDGYIFSEEDEKRMREILTIDHKAVILNGYYTNCGVEDGEATLADLIEGVEWNYYNRYNSLWGFLDGMVIPNGGDTVETAKYNFKESLKDNEVEYTPNYVVSFYHMIEKWIKSGAKEDTLYGDGMMDAGLLGELVMNIVDEA